MLNMKDDLRGELTKINLSLSKYSTICGVGGTLRAAKKLYNDLYGLPTDNMVMDAENFSDMLIRYGNERKVIIRKVIQLSPDRIHTIFTGMVILQSIILKYRCSQIIVSPYGVREGYLLQKVTHRDSICC
jgi:exopolyphosphatase/guanosine-5'-triphosphate,3'-diphosphate pyrophosphatase